MSPGAGRLATSAALLALVALAALTGCGSPPPDEERIRQQLESMAAGLVDRQAGAVLAPLADDFTGRRGRLDRRTARLLLMREFSAHERLRARLHGVEVDLGPSDRATADFRVLLTGGSGMIPSSGRWYEVTTGWRLDDGEWRLISASWDNVVGL